MNQKYSVKSTRNVQGDVRHTYRGRVNMCRSLEPPIMEDINCNNKKTELTQILRQHEKELDGNSKLIRIKTTLVEEVNYKGKLRNWLSRVWEDILVYTGPH